MQECQFFWGKKKIARTVDFFIKCALDEICQAAIFSRLQLKFSLGATIDSHFEGPFDSKRKGKEKGGALDTQN